MSSNTMVKWSNLTLLVILLAFIISFKSSESKYNNNNDDDDDSSVITMDLSRKRPYDYENYNYSAERPHNRGGKKRDGNGKKKHPKHPDGISLWINEQQLKMLSALFFPQASAQGRIYAIYKGSVLNDIREVNYFKYLTIPAEVSYVNFTWKSGPKKYFYHFDRLQTLDESILKAPSVSIKTKGRIPAEEKDFSIFLTCTGNNSGTAMFNVGLSIQTRHGKPLKGTPLRFNLKKQCAHRGVYDIDASNPSLTSSQAPDPQCSLKCGNNGFCNHRQICQCNSGFTGEYCQTAFCFPQCLNGGNCTAPSVCSCPEGYQGTQCEGGICTQKCQNGGKCIQKDKCQCSKGYFGLHCQYSKCNIPCKNKGKCIGNNICRCKSGFGGNHCEIGRTQRSTCKRPCKHGVCMPNKTCKCHQGFYGRFCNGKIKKKHRQNHR